MKGQKWKVISQRQCAVFSRIGNSSRLWDETARSVSLFIVGQPIELNCTKNCEATIKCLKQFKFLLRSFILFKKKNSNDNRDELIFKRIIIILFESYFSWLGLSNYVSFSDHCSWSKRILIFLCNIAQFFNKNNAVKKKTLKLEKFSIVYKRIRSMLKKKSHIISYVCRMEI